MRVDEVLELVGLTEAATAHRARLLRRHEAAPRHRDRSRAPAERPLPRRADDRPRSGGARRDVGRGRAAGGRGEPDDPAHDALPRGGRPARRARRDRQPRQGRGAGHARRAEGRPARRAHHHRPRGPRRAPAMPRCPSCTSSRARRSSPPRAGSCAPACRTAPRRFPSFSRRSTSRASPSHRSRRQRPSLDDVYLHYTGRDFSTEDQEAKR